ncbi:MAG: hypothetical protein LBV72_11875 [Tannerella sp.]|jgi:hypothetical protein|nr:hypothetical protein [Tannerella sp.]
MKKIIGILTLFSLFISCKENDIEEKDEFRDPYLWPFSQTSIWNMPIGSDAEYVPALFEDTDKLRMTVDEDYIVMKPNAPLTKVYYSEAGWNKNKDRCEHNGTLLFEAPFPHDWIISSDTWIGTTPNSGLATLMPDGETIKQTQPFAHCQNGDIATSKVLCKDVNIYGEGITGAHGGSRMSAIGGALRNHELTPTSGPIRHVLKVNVYANKNLYYDQVTKGYRWPAGGADSSAAGLYGTIRKTPPNKECRMGALLALPASLDIASLELKTEPARILAVAFQDYGAYIVDNTAWDVFAIITEWSPDGRFIDEFKKNWGFAFETTGTNSNDDWREDLRKIFSKMHIVINNTEATIGGGGTPRQKLAPPFKN